MGEALRKRIKALLRLDPQNYTTPGEFFNRHAPSLGQLSRPPYVPRTDVAGNSFTTDQVQLISDRIGKITARDWSTEKIEETMGDLACDVGGIEPRNLGADDVRDEAKSVGNAVGRYLRWALTGGRPGPGIRIVMIVLGRDVTLQRLQEANAEVQSSSLTERTKHDGISAAA